MIPRFVLETEQATEQWQPAVLCPRPAKVMKSHKNKGAQTNVQPTKRWTAQTTDVGRRKVGSENEGGREGFG